MIVVGADTHKDTHTAVAVDAASGQVLDELTAPARRKGFIRHLDWGRGLADGGGLVWAIEDCRHVSGGLERFLVSAGEKVIRVPPKLMGASRKGSRRPGKSDSIDATNVARAALGEGVDALPAAYLDEEAMQIKLLADHARTWFAPEATISDGCAGIGTRSTPTTRSPPVRWTGWSGSIGWRASSPAPPRARGS